MKKRKQLIACWAPRSDQPQTKRILEAMASGIPCMATDCTGMKELLSDGRGFLVGYEYVHIDPFGNGHRYWINRMEGVNVMKYIYEKRANTLLARQYVEKRTWDEGIDTLDKALE